MIRRNFVFALFMLNNQYIFAPHSKEWDAVFLLLILKFNLMKQVFLIILGSLVVLELVVRIVQSTKRAPDILWYLCRPFGIPMPMWMACIVRIALIAIGAVALYQGIGSFISF